MNVYETIDDHDGREPRLKYTPRQLSELLDERLRAVETQISNLQTQLSEIIKAIKDAR